MSRRTPHNRLHATVEAHGDTVVVKDDTHHEPVALGVRAALLLAAWLEDRHAPTYHGHGLFMENLDGEGRRILAHDGVVSVPAATAGDTASRIRRIAGTIARRHAHADHRKDHDRA